MAVSLASLKLKHLRPGREAMAFCDKLKHRSLILRVTRISPSSAVVGKCTKILNIPVQVEDALLESNVEGRNCFLFFRLLHRETLYVSES